MDTVLEQQNLNFVYNTLYTGKGELEDSPHESKFRIGERILQIMRDEELPNKNVVDLGSGPQVVEIIILDSLLGRRKWPREKRGERNILKRMFDSFKIYTVEIADTPKLLVSHASQHANNVIHIQADASNLHMVSNGFFGLVYSNHAWDFIPDRQAALKELNRITALSGRIVMNLHHADLVKFFLTSPRRTKSRIVFEQFEERGHIYDDPEKIMHDFSAYGIMLDTVELQSDSKDKWWHIEGHKVANIDELEA